VYEFLTDEEKDVEAEIKALDIDPSELTKQLESLFFDTILKHRKIKHQATGHEYSFSRKLDDHLLGREYELSINLITPLSEEAAAPEAVRMRSMTREDLAVVLSPDVRFMRDLQLFKQTDKYIRQTRAGGTQDSRERIISDKGEQNRRREKDLETRLRNLIAEAVLFVRGDELDIGGDDPQERLIKGFQTLIDKVYVNLPMLRKVTYTEVDILKAAQAKGGLFGGDDAGGMSEPEQEILYFVQAQARIGVNVSVKSLLEKFGAKPYGWPNVATLCIAGGLSAKGKLEARSQSTVLEGEELGKALRNSHALGNILLTPQTEYTAPQLRTAKDLYRALFATPADGTDARSHGAEWAEAIHKLDRELEGLVAQQAQYPFMQALIPMRDKVRAMQDKQPGWYITEPVKAEGDLLDAKEDVLDKIRSFMAGPQRAIYDEAKAFCAQQDANLSYIDPGAAARIAAVLNDPACFKGAAIQSLKADIVDMREKIDLQVLQERQAVQAAIDTARAKIVQTAEFQNLPEPDQAAITQRIDSHVDGLDTVGAIAVLRNRATEIGRSLVSDMLSEIARLTPTPPAPAPGPTGNDAPNDPPTAPRTPAFVNAADLPSGYPQPYVASEADLDEYLAAVKKTLLAEIQAGKKVIV
jgi:hypothetical protein